MIVHLHFNEYLIMGWSESHICIVDKSMIQSIRLSLHPINKYSLKFHFFAHFFYQCVQNTRINMKGTWLNISSGQTDRVQWSVPIMSSSAQLSHIGLTRGLLFLCHSLTDKQTLSLEKCYDFSGYKKTECSSNVLMNNLEIGAKKVLNDNRLWVTHFFNPLNLNPGIINYKSLN